jgi:molecular chaperone DnaJ
VTLVVDVPTKRSKEAREALRRFDELSGDSLTAVERASGTDTEPEKKQKPAIIERWSRWLNDLMNSVTE